MRTLGLRSFGWVLHEEALKFGDVDWAVLSSWKDDTVSRFVELPTIVPDKAFGITRSTEFSSIIGPSTHCTLQPELGEDFDFLLGGVPVLPCTDSAFGLLLSGNAFFLLRLVGSFPNDFFGRLLTLLTDETFDDELGVPCFCLRACKDFPPLVGNFLGSFEGVLEGIDKFFLVGKPRFLVLDRALEVLKKSSSSSLSPGSSISSTLPELPVALLLPKYTKRDPHSTLRDEDSIHGAAFWCRASHPFRK